MPRKFKDGVVTPVDATSLEGAPNGMTTGVAIVGFLLSFLSGAGLMWGYEGHRTKAQIGSAAADAAWSDDDSPVPVSSRDPVWGARDAPVTVVVFSDFQCPFCSRGEATLEQVKAAYGPEKLRVVWKNEPLDFHANAKPAAEVAQGVFALKGSAAFWAWSDLAFKNQAQLGEESYLAWAQKAGVTDVGKLKAGLAAHTWADKVNQDHALAQRAGVNATPAFFVNGSLLSGAQPFEKFKTVVDQELSKAQAKIASGTPRARVYAVMSAENKKPVAAPKTDTPPNPQDDSTTVFNVPIGSSPSAGNPDALVTIVEFSDFQCPFCKRGEDILAKLRAANGDKVRVVWKDEPLSFHPRAEPAAELAREARAEKGDRGFWAAHAALFEAQPQLEDADLLAVAAKLSLDPAKVKSAISGHAHKKEIDADNDLSVDLLAQGTPHFFLNGRRVVGTQPIEKFQKIIDEEVVRAQGLLAKGIPASKLYAELVKDGKGAPEPERKTVRRAASAPAKGNSKAKVVIQEFSDFQCPFCVRAEETIGQLMQEYGDRIQLEWRNTPLPMHADAPLAAQAALEAYKQKGADGFWKMHDRLFAGQKVQDGLKRPALEGYARALGLDLDKFKASLDTESHAAEVAADAQAAKDAGISGTPAFVINGYFINGAEPASKFRKVIDRALAEAK
jgi:protein-disulfide isomerase